MVKRCVPSIATEDNSGILGNVVKNFDGGFVGQGYSVIGWNGGHVHQIRGDQIGWWNGEGKCQGCECRCRG